MDLYSVQSFSHVQLFSTPWTAAHQASLSITRIYIRFIEKFSLMETEILDVFYVSDGAFFVYLLLFDL